MAGLLSGSAIVFLLALGLPPGHSAMFNYPWTIQYSEALSWSNPFPRYLPGLAAGFGGHDFFFYAPLPFWLIAAVVDPLCPGCTPATEFIVGSAFFLVASGFSMFAFLRCFFAARAAQFGAILYVLLPYHLLVDWIDRQAAGEFAAYAFIPLVALGVERMRSGRRGGLILAFGIAGMALSHLPTTLLAAHVFGVVVLVFVALASGGAGGRLWLLARYAWFALLGLALASFYWVPAVALLGTVSPEMLYDPYFEAWRWLYGRATQQPDAHYVLIITAAFLACLPFLLGSIFSARGPLLAWLLVPLAVALILNTAPSEPIWRHWIIAKVQFPWRLMTFVDFATGIAAAILLTRATTRVGWWVLAAAFLAAVGPTAYVARQVEIVEHFGSSALPPSEGRTAIEYLGPAMKEAVQARFGPTRFDHFDQIAVSATIAAMASDFRKSYPDVAIIDRGARSLTVLAPTGVDMLSVPVQHWFLWSAQTSTGVALELRPNPVFGTIDIIAPAGGFDPGPLRLWLRYHPSELVGGAVSLLAIVLLLIASLQFRRAAAEGPGPH